MSAHRIESMHSLLTKLLVYFIFINFTLNGDAVFPPPPCPCYIFLFLPLLSLSISLQLLLCQFLLSIYEHYALCSFRVQVRLKSWPRFLLKIDGVVIVIISLLTCVMINSLKYILKPHENVRKKCRASYEISFYPNCNVCIFL